MEKPIYHKRVLDGEDKLYDVINKQNILKLFSN
jgi:hypothetical protein